MARRRKFIEETSHPLAASHPGEDTFKMYLDDLKDAPELLTREQEIQLFQRVEKGDRAALHYAIEANLRLVVYNTMKFRGRGLEESDLVQWGNLGLIRACQSFDWRKGNKFSTYSTWWIRQAITRAVSDGSRTIRFPIHLDAQIMKLKWVENKISQATGRDPTDQQLAKKANLSLKHVRQVQQVRKMQPVSLNVPLVEHGDEIEQFDLESVIPDPSGPAEEEAVDDQVLSEKIRSALHVLTPMERRVITRRFGLSGKAPMTLGEIKVLLRLSSRETARKLEASALEKLRDPSIAKTLLVEPPSVHAL